MKAWIHHRKPLAVLKIVIVMLEGAPRVVRRVYENAFHATGVIGKQRLQRFKVVALNEHVRRVAISGAVRAVRFQKAVRHSFGGLDVFVAVQPLQNRHKVIPPGGVASVPSLTNDSQTAANHSVCGDEE